MIRRFVPPYKGYLVLSIVANILSAILNLLAFSLVMPILRILFQIDAKVTTYIPFSQIEWSLKGLSEAGHILNNNFSYYVGQLMDQYGVPHTLVLLSLYLVIMTALKVGAAYLGFYAMIPIRTGVVQDIRMAVFNKVISLPLSFLSGARKGDVMARITGDVGEVENSIMSSLDMMLKNPILILFYLGTMLILSWQLTLFVLVLLPIAGVIMGRVGKTLKRNSLETQTLSGQLMSQIEETLGGLRIIKAFTSEEYISNRFLDINDKFRRSLMRLFRRQQLAHPMSELLGTIAIAIVLWYGGVLITTGVGGIDASTFIYYLVVFYSLINPMKELSKAVYTIRKGMGAMERIDSILLAESNIKEQENPLPLTFEQGIKFEHVSFRYQDEWVLRDINLEIKKGQTVALVGQSGGGKSTLVDLIPRFYDVQEGRITIDGIDIRDVRLKDLRLLMGNVNQEPILFNDSIANNISFGTEQATPDAIRKAAEVAYVHEFVDQMPELYETNIGDRGGRLSGGQRQRLSIARAVYKNPPILILDEATSALDTTSERYVQQALERLMTDRTTIVIAHRLSTIIHADLICVIQDGRIVERGKHEELLALGGQYTQLYNLQLSKKTDSAEELY